MAESASEHDLAQNDTWMPALRKGEPGTPPRHSCVAASTSTRQGASQAGGHNEDEDQALGTTVRAARAQGPCLAIWVPLVPGCLMNWLGGCGDFKMSPRWLASPETLERYGLSHLPVSC